MELKFGTSGLRGLATELLGGPTARFTHAFIDHLLQSGQIKPGAEVFVGRDLRDSSPALAGQCLQALADAGVVPVDCGALPTPALALYAGSRGSAAIMVTGSHIPADRNGLKFYRPDGEIDKSDEAAIVALAASAPATAQTSVKTNQPSQQADAAWRMYHERCLSILKPGALSGLRIGVYQHSSVARDFLVTVLEELGAETLAVGRSDDFVPVDTEALGAETEELLRQWVERHRLHALVSTDADADRPLVIDDKGSQVRGDIIGLFTARFLGATRVATPVTSSSGIEIALAVDVARTRVGSPYVIAGMKAAEGQEGEVVVGFEGNGGFMLASPVASLVPLPTRDSALPILATLGEAGGGLSARVADMNLPICLSDRLEHYPVEASRSLMDSLAKDPASIDRFVEGIGVVESTDWTDGLRIGLEGGDIVHLRPSGNAPEMRCYVEASTVAKAQSLLRSALDRLRAY